MPRLIPGLKIFLFPLSLIFTFIVFLRNKFYDWSWFRSRKVPVPVISIGNIQIGGTGKTPFAEYLARKVLEMGGNPVILTRGYRRKNRRPVIVNEENKDRVTPEEIGDEPFLLARNLPGVTIGVDANRYRMARRILRKQPETLFILDDAFQHRQLQRNLDILLIDASRWFATPFLFPVSPFRDIKSSIRRADSVILTRNELNPDMGEKLAENFRQKYGSTVLTARMKPEGLVNVVSGENLSLKEPAGKKIAAFCGLAHPGQFFGILEKQGAKIYSKKNFPDHHFYSEKEIREIVESAEERHLDWIVTTQKDAVKIERKFAKLARHIWYLKISMTLSNERFLLELLNKC